MSKVLGALFVMKYERDQLRAALKTVADWHEKLSNEAIGQWDHGPKGVGARTVLHLMRRDVMPQVHEALNLSAETE